MKAEKRTRLDKFFKRFGLVGAILVVISCVTLVAFLVLDLAEVNPFIMDGPRIYWVQFESEEVIVMDVKYRRGESIKTPNDPVHSEDEYYKYAFKGWDLNDDKRADLIPPFAYSSFRAVAIYSKKQIKARPSSNSDSSSNSEDNSSGANNG